MSGHAAAPAPAPAAAAAPGPALPQDPVKDLALQIYVELAGHVYSGGMQDKPEPKAVAMLSFKLAEAFLQTHREINAVVIEAARKRSNFNFDDLDMGSMMKG